MTDVLGRTVPARREMTGARFANELVAATFLPLVLVGAAMLAVPTEDRILWFIGISGAPHVAAGFAFYLDRDARPVLASDPRRFLVAPVLLIAAFGLFGAVSSGMDPRVPTTAFTVFLVWQFHHFSRQNFGVLSLALKAWGSERVTDREARLIQLGGWASMTGGVRPIRQVFGPFLVPDLLINLAFAVGAALMVAALVELYRLRRTADRRRMGMLVGLTLFHLPLFVMSAPTVALGLHAAAHPFQYGLIMWRTREGRDQRGTMTMTLVFVGLVIGGGYLLRQTASSGTQFVGLAAGIGWGFVAWHFVLDAGVWKLSKPEPRAYMKRRFAFL